MTARVVLDPDQISHFHREGYLVVDQPLASPEELDGVRRLIGRLFDRFDTLPPELAYDLGDVQHHEGVRQIPEINNSSRLEPSLTRTAVFDRCRDVASQLLGSRSRLFFDHAILKPPSNAAATEWHQDLSTAPKLRPDDAVHIWLPLQDVDEDNGCMHFIPDREHRALRAHQRRAPGSHALMIENVDATDAVVCPIRAGMATCHRLTTLHYTGPNRTDAPRLAWIMHFHRDAPRSSRLRARVVMSRAKARLRSSLRG